MNSKKIFKKMTSDPIMYSADAYEKIKSYKPDPEFINKLLDLFLEANSNEEYLFYNMNFDNENIFNYPKRNELICKHPNLISYIYDNQLRILFSELTSEQLYDILFFNRSRISTNFRLVSALTRKQFNDIFPKLINEPKVRNLVVPYINKKILKYINVLKNEEKRYINLNVKATKKNIDFIIELSEYKNVGITIFDFDSAETVKKFYKNIDFTVNNDIIINSAKLFPKIANMLSVNDLKELISIKKFKANFLEDHLLNLSKPSKYKKEIFEKLLHLYKFLNIDSRYYIMNQARIIDDIELLKQHANKENLKLFLTGSIYSVELTNERLDNLKIFCKKESFTDDEIAKILAMFPIVSNNVFWENFLKIKNSEVITCMLRQSNIDINEENFPSLIGVIPDYYLFKIGDILKIKDESYLLYKSLRKDAKRNYGNEDCQSC